jgi:excisionase family DNA binding protein
LIHFSSARFFQQACDSAQRKELTMENRISLSPAEACQIAGIGMTQLREEIAEGRLVARRMGRRVLIAVADLRLWLDNLPRVAA